jgi:hypothetical protein
MVTDKKMVNDATASVGGTIFQICVALERAFMLEEGQKMWIEKFGDVTVSGQEQIETKLYSDTLTDNHPNFWNTLKNWLLPSFNHSPYTYLTLLTTQPIGSQSKFLEWNDALPTRRLQILSEILEESENRYVENQRSSSASKRLSPPQSLVLQRNALGATQSDKLREIVSKLWIESDSPKLKELRKKIFDVHGKTILRAKSSDFLDDLMGYLIGPRTTQNGWEISFEDFSAKLTDVSNHYRRGTVIFPSKNIAPTAEQIDLHAEKLFVKKLREIEHLDAISEAIQDYLSASTTVLEELKNYDVSPANYQAYESNLRSLHRTRHRLAKRQLAGEEPVAASQNFYDVLTSEAVQPFYCFEQTPYRFRNGVFHILADADSDDFYWKLW